MIAGIVAAIICVFDWIIGTGEPWMGGLQGIINSLLISVPIIQLELAGCRWRLLRAHGSDRVAGKSTPFRSRHCHVA